MDQELIAYLDQRFRETAKHIDTLHRETTKRLESVEGAIRQIHVTVEGLRRDVQLLGRGVLAIDDKAERFRSIQFEELRRLIERLYKQLEHRLTLLEDRASREGRNPMDIVRERLGKTAGRLPEAPDDSQVSSVVPTEKPLLSLVAPAPEAASP